MDREDGMSSTLATRLLRERSNVRVRVQDLLRRRSSPMALHYRIQTDTGARYIVAAVCVPRRIRWLASLQ